MAAHQHRAGCRGHCEVPAARSHEHERADVLALPHSGLGLPILQVRVVALPLVTFAVAPMSEVAASTRPSSTPPGVHDMADAIVAVLNDALRDRLRTAGFDIARGHGPS